MEAVTVHGTAARLIHEEAHQATLPLELPGIDSKVLDVRILACRVPAGMCP